MEERKKKNQQRKIDMKGFSYRLRTAMSRVNVSQSELAERVGLTQPQINNYLSGKSTPRTLVRQRLAYELNIRYHWLCWDEGKAEYEGSKYPVEDFWLSFSERLSYLIWKDNMNTIDYSEVLGITSTAVHLWTEGKRFPEPGQLHEICMSLNTNPLWLKNGKGNMDDVSRQPILTAQFKIPFD